MKKMRVLVIGGNRFVGLRLVYLLEKLEGCELHVLNRTGQVAHAREAIVHKGDRRHLAAAHLDADWDAVVDFAAFNAEDARQSLAFFRSVGRYVFISTASVYDLKGGLREERFDAKAFSPDAAPTEAEKLNPYQFGKRQAEAVFAREAKFPVLSVRFPFILGPDDYTGRLEFHVERVREGRPIYFPNLDARTSMIHSEDAALTLYRAIPDLGLEGALNVASPDAVSLRQMMEWIEKKEGKKALIMKKDTPEIYSPYGVEHDWWLNTERLQTSGYTLRPIRSWLPELIAGLGPAAPSGVH